MKFCNVSACCPVTVVLGEGECSLGEGGVGSRGGGGGGGATGVDLACCIALLRSSCLSAREETPAEKNCVS